VLAREREREIVSVCSKQTKNAHHTVHKTGRVRLGCFQTDRFSDSKIRVIASNCSIDDVLGHKLAPKVLKPSSIANSSTFIVRFETDRLLK